MRWGVFILWSFLIAVASLRIIQTVGINPPAIDACVKHEIRGEGIVAVEPERKESGQVFVVEAEDVCGMPLRLRVKSPAYPRLAYGDRIEFEGTLSKPFNFRSDSGREFDYQGYLAKDDIFFEMKSATVRVVAVAGDADGPSFVVRQLFRVKRAFVSRLERALGEPHAALAAGLVVGEKSALGAQLLDDFRTVGLIHIVVLSGYNITIVADALRRILSFVPLSRAWGIVAGGGGIALFGILVGGGATVVRSCFMAGIALSADLMRRDYSVHRALAFAALVMLIQNPRILFDDPSFQLSFLATLALIVLAEPFEKLFWFVPEKFGMRGIIASTIATQVFVAPYILYMMGSISLIGLIVNILVLPIIPLTMLAVFATGVIGPWVPPVAWAAHALLSYELFMVERFARVPFAALEVPVFPVWVVWVAYGAIIASYVAYVRFARRVI